MDPNSALTPEEEERENAAKDLAIAEADEDVAAGRVVAHDRVMAWLAAWARGERPPPPE